jgi:DNA-binding transcriptional MerR regulator
VDLIGIEAQLVAIKKYLRDTEQKPSYQTARDVLKRELVQAKEVKAQIEELSLQIQEERMGVGVNDAASQSDDKLFEQYHSAVSKESRWLVQRGQSLGRDIRTEVNRLERLIAGFTRQAERVVDQRIADYKQMVKQEQLKVNQYTGQLGGHEASTRALGGVIAARTFVAVLDRIASIVLNADVGLVDVAWKRKDDKSKEISRVYEQQSGEEQRLKGLFDEAKANGE